MRYDYYVITESGDRQRHRGEPFSNRRAAEANLREQTGIPVAYIERRPRGSSQPGEVLLNTGRRR